MHLYSLIHKLDQISQQCGSPQALQCIYLLRNALLDGKLSDNLPWERRLELCLRCRTFLKLCQEGSRDGALFSALREVLFALCRPVWIRREFSPEKLCYRQTAALHIFRDFCAKYYADGTEDIQQRHREEKMTADSELTMLEDSCRFLLAYQRAFRADRVNEKRLRRVRKLMRRSLAVVGIPDLVNSITGQRVVLAEESRVLAELFRELAATKACPDSCREEKTDEFQKIFQTDGEILSPDVNKDRKQKTSNPGNQLQNLKGENQYGIYQQEGPCEGAAGAV